MAFHTQGHYDTKADTTALLQQPFRSPLLEKGNDSDDDSSTNFTGRVCRMRQFATPSRFFAIGDSFSFGLDSSDSAEWMHEFEQIARANNWSSRCKLEVIPIYFGERSTKTWFEENYQEWPGGIYSNIERRHLDMAST
ncbi:hypothetical protein BGZ83_011333 [Gryganskiella cystojenkinii]|nr:hypothetical protein BGZ83_011333 [Gryganskiella cystojenkinii]